jgi:outer membrane protein insertion porin family
MLANKDRRTVVCKVLVLCTALLMYTTAAEAEVSKEEQIEKSLPGDGVSKVTVDTTIGDVRLFSWEKPEVLVKASKKVTADDDEKAQEFSDKIEIKIERVEDRIQIKTSQPLFSGSIISGKVKAWVEYDIFVPEAMNLDVKTRDGAIHATEIRGKLKINTLSGSIELKNVVGSVSAETATGDIYGEVLFDAESKFSTVNGSIDIRVGDTFSVPISARTISGSIDIAVPEGFSADVDASAISGGVSCDFLEDGTVDGNSLKGKLFGGGPLMELRAISGNISVNTSKERVEEAPVLPVRVKEKEMPKLEIPRAEAVKTLAPPVIDGRLDDDCWKDAGRITNFVWADGIGKPYESTEAYLLWDDSNLYIGIRCYESSMDAIRISNTERDKDDWKDDMVQIFIDTTPEAAEMYYHVAVNPIGAVFDQEVEEARQDERMTRRLKSRFLDLEFKEAKKRRIVKSKLGVRWNTGGLFDTDMRSDLWSIEAGIPFSALKAKPEEGGIWRFNLYRMEQRREEHSYWSPTYMSDNWPHVPFRFGELVFTSGKLVKEAAPEPPVPSEGALTISRIVVKGNSRISEEEILKALELEPGDLAEVDALSYARLRLESLGWFRNVGLELVENDKGVDLVVKIVEKEIISPSEVQVRGSALFTEKQIIDYFNFGPFVTTKEDVDVKCRLIESLYKAKGYEMAAANCSVISNNLVIDIDEGNIDKIEISGNDKVRTRDIVSSLDLEPGMPYKKDRIDGAIYTMRTRLPYFRSVNWRPGRSDDGLNVVYIDVKETDLTRHDFDLASEFNRVHGLQLGPTFELESIYSGSKGYCKFLYGFSSEIWDYQFGIEKSWFRSHKSTIGVDIHKITDTNDWELVSNTEHFIAEAILGEAWRDFYQRQGYELRFGQKLTPSNEFGIRYRDDEYSSLEKTEDWSVLNRSYADEDWYDEFRWAGGRGVRSRTIFRLDKDDKYKPENPPIEEGRMRSVIAEYMIDTRNSEKDPANGWFNTFSIEYAGRDLGGDYDFNIYKANIRRYNRLSGNQFLTFRIKAATTDRALSELHPRRFYLGGIGTLRGYRFKEFEGDKMVLLNAEYWVMTRWPPGFGIVFFVDSGYAWPYDLKMEIDDMKTDLGVGFQWGALRVNVASPIEERDRETDFVLSARIARMF